MAAELTPWELERSDSHYNFDMWGVLRWVPYLLVGISTCPDALEMGEVLKNVSLWGEAA